MFKDLQPVLRDRAVLLTVTLLDEDQIRVNIAPKKLKDGDNDALTTPLSVTRHSRGTRRGSVEDHPRLCRRSSSDEEHPGEGKGRDGCGFEGGAG